MQSCFWMQGLLLHCELRTALYKKNLAAVRMMINAHPECIENILGELRYECT